MNVAGREVEVDQYQEEADEETIKYPTDALGQRKSFINMRNQMQAAVRHHYLQCAALLEC